MPLEAYQLTALESMRARYDIKIARTAHKQFSRLSIIQRQGRASVVKDQAQLLKLLISFPGTLESLIHRVDDHAGYILVGIMSRHDGIDEVIFFELTLVFRHVGHHPWRNADAIPSVCFMGEVHNRHA